MPGFTTHYLFGHRTYQALDNENLKQLIRRCHAPYSLGLQGPDIFFYFLPSYLIHRNNIGSIAHIEKTNTFLYYLLESRKLFPDKQQRHIAEAYIAGFLGHYVLDTHCHPYVYWMTHFKGKDNRYHGAHMSLETDIDKELLQFYRRRQPSEFRQDSTIRLTNIEKCTIAAILHYVYHKTYPDLHVGHPSMRAAICSMQTGCRLLHDPSGRKKLLVRRLEGVFLGYPLLSPMIPSNRLSFHLDPLNVLHRQWQNPWDKNFTSRESFFDLLEESQKEYTAFLEALYALFSSKMHTQKERKQTAKLLLRLGNNSYHSGLDAGIPS